jgi:hypothetical protein
LTPSRYILSYLLDIERWIDELFFDIYGHDGRTKGRNPTPWIVHPSPCSTFDEDIALGYAWNPLKELMLDHSTPWTLATTTY